MTKIEIIPVRVLPSKQYEKVVGQTNEGTIKIAVKAKPKDGEANRALIKFLSKKLKIDQSKIKIIAGFKSRNKLVSIERNEKESLIKILEEH